MDSSINLAKAMIPLTTKLPAICSLLQRVLEIEETTRNEEWNKVCMLFLENPQTAWDAFNKGFRAGCNITKPQATELLGDIEAWQAIANYASVDLGAGLFVRDIARQRLQSIADAFPDALFSEVDEKCPKCGSSETSKGHVGPESYVGETDFKRCDDCGHQWDHQ